MHDIVIIGAGGLAKEVAFLIDETNKQQKKWNILGYIVEDEKKIGKKNGKYTVYKTDYWLKNHKSELHVAFGIGDPKLNQKLSNSYKKNRNLHYPNIIHPNFVGDLERIKMSIGNIICAGNIFTTDIKLGSFNIFNHNCIIGHDAVIGNYNVINPSVILAGGVKIADRNLVCTHVKIIQCIKICSETKIGVGSIVMNNISKKGTYFGIPAKLLR